MKPQVLIIHGGTSFDNVDDYLDFIHTRDISLHSLECTYDWKASLPHEFPNIDVLQPRMPNSTNARYAEWAAWFERCSEFVDNGVILVGHSLGGIFLAKYLSHNQFPKTIRATILVAAPFDTVSTKESLHDFELPNSLELLKTQGGEIYIIHSDDDPIVPVGEVDKYKRFLTDAEKMILQDRQHFDQETFPELYSLIESLLESKA